MYDLEGFFVSNPANRFGIGSMAEKLQPDADGGLTICIQHDSPGKDKEVNWLPAPRIDGRGSAGGSRPLFQLPGL